MGSTKMKRPQFVVAAVITIFSLVSFSPVNAKEAAPQVLVWPTTGTPVVRFTFSKFKETGSSGKNHIYSTQVTAENLWTKKITSLEFTLYVYDKNQSTGGRFVA
jgi:hypothetical protein